MPAVAAALLAAGIASAGLTPMGAEQAGNADGAIPAWDGGVPSELWPAQGGALADPFPGDEPLFTIDATNWREHASRLAAGHRALFEKYPDFRLPVYATRRSVAFSEAIQAATAANRGHARLVGADGVEDAALGVPFPEPRSGVEVLWNHRLRYRGDSSEWRYLRVASLEGRQEVGEALERSLFGYASLSADAGLRSMQSYNLLRLEPAPPYPDITAVWHDAVNPLLAPRRIWSGTRGRSVRNPPLGYDQVGMFSHRIRPFDMLDMFSGAFDRYVFKLLGKREVYVPYNAYRLAATTPESFGREHAAHGAARYELHRVWVVEASLRPGEAHSLARRVFYVDEDSWSILLADDYDRTGVLARFQEGHLVPLYRIGAVEYAPLVTYDLPGRRYFIDRLVAHEPMPAFNLARLGRRDFGPEIARAEFPALHRAR